MSHMNQSAVAGPYVFERGGLTSVNELDATTAVARFDFLRGLRQRSAC